MGLGVGVAVGDGVAVGGGATVGVAVGIGVGVPVGVEAEALPGVVVDAGVEVGVLVGSGLAVGAGAAVGVLVGSGEGAGSSEHAVSSMAKSTMPTTSGLGILLAKCRINLNTSRPNLFSNGFT